MTCAETRDLFSALADDALAPSERVALDDHLAGCPECRRELAALLRTVKLVRAIDPAHAPAGFVDRVLAAARPTPWPTRLARRLAPPWPALPLGAAALLVMGGLAVLLFRAAPEQQRAAQTMPSSTPAAPTSSPIVSTPSPTPPAPSPTAAAPSPPAPTPSSTPPASSRENKSVEPAPATDKRADTRTPAREAAPRAESPRTMADQQAPAPPRVAENRAAKRESSDRAKAKDPAQPKEAQDSVERLAKAGAAPPSVAQSTVGQSTSGAPDTRTGAAAASKPATPQVSPLSRTGPMTGIPGAPPDVTARLRVADVSSAERSLIALAARVGGRQTGRRIDGGRLVVELAVPRDAYADFVREATALGAVSIEHQATERPMLGVAVTVVR